MGSYVALFHGIHIPPGSRISLRDSYLMTMASLAATRLFAAGGAGGVALTAWALRRAGLPRREVAERMIAFIVLLYAVYVVAMIVCGLGLRTGLFPGPAPFGLTVLPAIVGLVAVVLFIPLIFVPEDFPERIERMSRAAAEDGEVAAAAGARSGLDARRDPLRAAQGAPSRPRDVRRRDLVDLQRRDPVGLLPRLRRRAAAGRRRSRATSSACSATCCRCRAGSAASTAA